ncbi:MAG: RNA polymerase sigma-70 factor (ECF subfamily) [Halioglobus sp.]|jgi:RNA polymerase sigma-70 factor (family 1)
MSKSKKEQKFNALYAEWVQPLFRFIYFKTKNQSLSEDIVQDTFVKFWDKIDTVGKGKEKSYLFASAKNLLLNKIAHEKIVDTHAKTQIESSVKSPHYDLEVSEFKQKLELAISKLPDNQKEVFLMNRIDGYKYREIAELLKISQKAVEKRMSQALKQLRKLHIKI